MPHKRRRVSGTELHDVLVREFTRTCAGLCPACAVPRPVFMETRGDRPNWRVPALGECDGLCHTILQDVAEALGRRYEMARPRAAR